MTLKPEHFQDRTDEVEENWTRNAPQVVEALRAKGLLKSNLEAVGEMVFRTYCKLRNQGMQDHEAMEVICAETAYLRPYTNEEKES